MAFKRAIYFDCSFFVSKCRKRHGTDEKCQSHAVCCQSARGVSFREDESRVRKDNAPENLAVLRHIALNLLKQSSRKASIKAKRKIAGWDNEYLAKLVWG